LEGKHVPVLARYGGHFTSDCNDWHVTQKTGLHARI